MTFRITVEEWRKLPEDERELFKYVSNIQGCFFEYIESVAEDPNENIDEYELLKRKEEQKNG